jgi:hypothetical protein
MRYRLYKIVNIDDMRKISEDTECIDMRGEEEKKNNMKIWRYAHKKVNHPNKRITAQRKCHPQNIVRKRPNK